MTAPMVHFEPVRLRLVSSDDRKQSIFLQKFLSKLEAEVIRASSCIIGLGQSIQLSSLVIHRICPHQVAEKSRFRYLFRPLNFLNICDLHNPIFTLCTSVDIPPCTHKNLLLMMAERGKLSKRSMTAS